MVVSWGWEGEGDVSFAIGLKKTGLVSSGRLKHPR